MPVQSADDLRDFVRRPTLFAVADTCARLAYRRLRCRACVAARAVRRSRARAARSKLPCRCASSISTGCASICRPSPSIACIAAFSLFPPRGQLARVSCRSAELVCGSFEALLAVSPFRRFERFDLDLELHDPAMELVQLGRHAVVLDAQPGRGLVDQVDRLVRQEAVGDVSIAQRRRRRRSRSSVMRTPWCVSYAASGRAGSRSCPRRSARRRSPAGSGAPAPASFSMCLRYSSSVVAPMRAARRAPARASAGCRRPSAFGLAGADDGVQSRR